MKEDTRIESEARVPTIPRPSSRKETRSQEQTTDGEGMKECNNKFSSTVSTSPEMTQEEIDAKWDAFCEIHDDDENLLSAEEAEQVIKEYEADTKKPLEVWNYNLVVASYARSNPAKAWEAERLVDEMYERGLGPDSQSYFWVIHGFSRDEGCNGGSEGFQR